MAHHLTADVPMERGQLKARILIKTIRIRAFWQIILTFGNHSRTGSNPNTGAQAALPGHNGNLKRQAMSDTFNVYTSWKAASSPPTLNDQFANWILMDYNNPKTIPGTGHPSGWSDGEDIVFHDLSLQHVRLGDGKIRHTTRM